MIQAQKSSAQYSAKGFIASTIGLIAILLLMLANSSFAFELSNQQTQIPIGSQLEYFEDTDNSHTWASIAKLPDTAWSPTQSQTPSFGYTTSAIWFRGRIHYTGHEPSLWVLYVQFALIDHIDLYTHSSRTGLRHARAGDQVHYSEWPVPSTDPIFPLRLEAGEQIDLFIRIKNKGSVQLPITLWRADVYEYRNNTVILVFGMYFGILAVMTLYNFVLYLLVRDQSYLLYVCFVLTFGLYQACSQGYAHLYLWPDAQWWHDRSTLFFMSCSLGFACLFSSSILALDKYSPRYNYFLFSIASISFFCALLTLIIGWRTIALALSGFGLVACSSMLVVGSILSFRGVRAAQLFTIAWIGLIMGTVFFVLNRLGFIPRTFFTEYGMLFGSASEMVLLSLALAVRINDLKRKQTETEKMAVAAAAESKAKSTFLATMSHEIRTPMNGVLGMVEMIQETDLSDRQRRYIDTIEHSGHALLTVINDILDYSKIEAGKMDIESIPVTLPHLIDECMKVFSIKASEKTLSFWAQIGLDVPITINADPIRLRQIIINLLSNAFKFTEQGSVQLCVFKKNNLTLRIEVIDSGVGIPENIQNHLFQTFSQADKSTTRLFGGTGLGLSICKRLVQLMGGEIGVISKTGKGACFWIELPLSIPTSNTTLLGDPDSLLNHGGSVLLALKEHPLQNYLAQLLSAWGLRVDCASNATELIEALKRHHSSTAFPSTPPWDLFLIDYGTEPTLDLEQLELMNDVHKNRQTKFVLAIPPEMHSQIVRLNTPNITYIIEKPITFSDIKEILLKTFSKQYNFNKPTYKKQMADFSHLSVIVAEDNKVNQMVIEGILNKFSIKPRIVQNGYEAVEVLKKRNEIDLIFMDCEMPVMDGLSATQSIRAFQSNENLIIIGLSANVMQEQIQNALESGMNDYIIKPVSKADINNILNRYKNHWQKKSL